MPLTKVTSSLINTISVTQIQTVAADAGKVLTSDGLTPNWVASSSLGGSGASYTTVGVASAGVFASAVCFIPSSPGTGSWTAPAGVYTARVTIVGGGGGGTNGGRSHFNYASGTTPGANQMYAAGGTGNGSAAGWNGITVAGGVYAGAEWGGSVSVGGGGAGSAGGGGYGGGGGAGGFDGGGASYGNAGYGSSGGSGGIGGDGGGGAYVTIGDTSMPTQAFSIPGTGGGSPQLSYAATVLPNFAAAIAQNPGRGGGGGSVGGGGGWCSAIVSVTPGTSYAYAVGAAGTGASYGMVVIEW